MVARSDTLPRESSPPPLFFAALTQHSLAKMYNYLRLHVLETIISTTLVMRNVYFTTLP